MQQGPAKHGTAMPPLERKLWWAFILVNGLIYLDLSIGTPICGFGSDCMTYIPRMGHGHFLTSYFDTFATNIFGKNPARPWFVPAFFSLFGSYNLTAAANIVFAQSVIFYIAWVVFAAVVSSYFKGGMARVAFVLLMLSAYIQQYYLFNRYLFSDSLGLSSVLFFLSAVFGFSACRRKFGDWTATILVIVSVLVSSGTRDSNLFILLCGTAYLVLLNRADWAKRYMLVLVFGVATLAVVQSVQSAKWFAVYNIGDIIAGFVIPTPEVRQYFEDRGMPYRAPPGVTLPVQTWCGDSSQVWANRKAANIRGRWMANASGIWTGWLVTHPLYVAGESFKDRNCILGQSFVRPTIYDSPPNADAEYPTLGSKLTGINHGAYRIAPSDFFGVDTKIFLAIVGFLILLAARFRNAEVVPVSLLLIPVGAANAVMSLFAELIEPQRHALVGSVLFNLGFLVCMMSLVPLLSRLAMRGKRPGRIHQGA